MEMGHAQFCTGIWREVSVGTGGAGWPVSISPRKDLCLSPLVSPAGGKEIVTCSPREVLSQACRAVLVLPAVTGRSVQVSAGTLPLPSAADPRLGSPSAAWRAGRKCHL